MIYAVVGANFKGITWRSKGTFDSSPNAGRLEQLVIHLQKYADDLGAARPVNWITTLPQKPFSAISSGNILFVLVLHPEYLQKGKNSKDIRLPLDLTPQEGTLLVSPPKNILITSGKTLFGKLLYLERNSGGVQIKYHFGGSGEMFIFTLSKKPQDHLNGR